MTEDQNNIAQLLEKLSGLMKRHESFQREIEDLRREIDELGSREAEPEPKPVLREEPALQPVARHIQERQLQEETEKAAPKEKKRPDIRLNLEKFIGENLINKIGIVITVIGVGIGAKYAIDHQLISPWTRIILGYLLGLGLLGFAFYLRKQYEILFFLKPWPVPLNFSQSALRIF